MKNKLEFMRLYNQVSDALHDKSTISFVDYVFYEQVVLLLGSKPCTGIAEALLKSDKEGKAKAWQLIQSVAAVEGIK